MTTIDTQGWDLVAGISQSALNAALQSAYDRDKLPHAVTRTAELNGLAVSIDLRLGAPAVDLARAEPDVAVIDIPITSESTFSIQGIIERPLAGGTVSIQTALSQIRIDVQGSPRARVFIDLLSDRAVFNLSLRWTTEPWIQALLDLIVASAFRALPPGQYPIADVDLGAALPSWLIPQEVDFSMYRAGDRNPDVSALLILVKTLGPGGSKVFTDTIIPVTATSAILVSNERLLRNVLGQELTRQLPGAAFNYAPNHLTLAQRFPFGEYMVEGISARVENGEIKLDFLIAGYHVAMTGGGLNIAVLSPSSITVTIETAEGRHVLRPHTVTHPSTTAWWLEWWVYLVIGLAAVVGTLIGGIIAAMIAVTVGLIAQSIAGPLAQGIISAQLTSGVQTVTFAGIPQYEMDTVSLPGPLRVLGQPTF